MFTIMISVVVPFVALPLMFWFGQQLSWWASLNSWPTS